MAEDKPRRANGRRIQLALGVLVLLGLGAAAYWYEYVRGTVYSDDARIDADLVDLAPELSGTLDQVRVHEGDHVTRGDVLFRLDRALLKATVAQAQAEVLSARAAQAMATAGYDKAKHGPRSAEIRVATQAAERTKAQTKLAETTVQRSKHLLEAGALPKAEFDRAQTNWETAAHAEQEAIDRLRLLRQGTRNEDKEAAKAAVAAAEARVTAAEAAVHQAQIRLDHAEVRAPFDGVVVRRWREPGAMLAPGVAVLTLMNPATLHVAANVEEKDLGEIAVGDDVKIDIDAFPQRQLHGHVTRILRATNSEFSMIPAEGVSGTFIKVTQRVPIRIAFDALPDLALGPGLSVEVRIQRGNGQLPPSAEAMQK